MAIFGKKKDKNAAGATPSVEGSTTNSPPLDGARSPTSRDGHGAQQPEGILRSGGAPEGILRSGPGSGGGSHNASGSISGTLAGLNSGAGSSFAPSANGSQAGSLRGPGGPPQGLGMGSMGPAGGPGGASGFKFGGGAAAPRQDYGSSSSGIPGPASGVRVRKQSQDSIGSAGGYGVANMGASGMMSVGSNMGPGGPISGLPPSSGAGMGPPVAGAPGGIPGAPGAPGVPGGSTRSQSVVYPWSQRSLVMNPPRFLDETRQAPPGALSPSPFPRYGHAANSLASAAGEVYLFGGLVRESVKNDLYTVYVDKVIQPPGTAPPGAPPGTVALGGGVNATLVQTTGEIPPPRVGHATVLVSNVLILWGGDTKVRADDKQDEGLYLLNLSTREWTRVRHSSESPDAGPVGRYGHTVSIVGSRFYVFGGQVDGTFMNDIWSFDLNSLKSTPTWELLRPAGTAVPPRRTGHASVTYRDRIFVFGGTDGQYHYNDTWCYDVTTNSWEELSCIGYIPVPREGHATCLVDDVMYIFGGRGVDGKDLGDLASFKISNQRWYMFANMGPSPSGRSGHALTAYQNKVVVLGGESFTGGKPDDPATVYVLDTGKIKYPPDSKSGSARKSTLPGGAAPAPGIAPAPGAAAAPGADPSRNMSPVAEDARRAASPTQAGARGPQTNGLMSAVAPVSSPIDAQAKTPYGAAAPADVPARAMSPTQQTVREQRAAALQGGGPTSGMQAPSILAVQQQQQQQQAQQQPGPTLQAQQPAPYNGPRSQRSLENMRSQAASPPARGLNGSLDRNASPAPGDAFHYGRGASPPVQANGSSLAGVMGGVPSPAEVESLRRREQWMRAALAMAAKRGFIAPEQLDMPDGSSINSSEAELNLDDLDTGAEGSEKDRVLRALITLKTQLASAKVSQAASPVPSDADNALCRPKLRGRPRASLNALQIPIARGRLPCKRQPSTAPSCTRSSQTTCPRQRGWTPSASRRSSSSSRAHCATTATSSGS
jgi:hypothetical protein